MREPAYFARWQDFEAWMEAHHASDSELLVCFHKVDSGTPSMSWPESVDVALCFGWIDGVRKRIDAARYSIRFTPRKSGSIWSAINDRKYAELCAAERVRPAGLAAYAKRQPDRAGVYSYEQRPETLPAPWAAELARHGEAAAWFAAQPGSYRRAAIWWIVSAKQEATRARRLQQLIAHSQQQRRLPAFDRP